MIFSDNNVTSIPKMVVFDLDETIGYFKEFGILWYSISKYFTNAVKIENMLNQCFFNNLLDLFPEFLRPNIISILFYLKEKKEKMQCDKILIYTNNRGPRIWTEYIQTYFNEKINYNLFDQIITAFKLNGKITESCRTCSAKNTKDLIRCAQMPQNTQIVFIDDVFHNKMVDDNIFYINVKPYIYCISFEDMIERIVKSKILDETIINTGKFKNQLLFFMNEYKFTYIEKPKIEYKIDNILSKKILEHFHTFFNQYYNNYTLKKRIILNKTRKSLQLNKTIE